MLYEVAILKNKGQTISDKFDLIADDKVKAYAKAVVRANLSEQEIDEMEILIRPFV